MLNFQSIRARLPFLQKRQIRHRRTRPHTVNLLATGRRGQRADVAHADLWHVCRKPGGGPGPGKPSTLLSLAGNARVHKQLQDALRWEETCNDLAVMQQQEIRY